MSRFATLVHLERKRSIRTLLLAGLTLLSATAADAACPKGARRQSVSTTTFSASACVIDLDEDKDESVVVIAVALSSGGEQRLVVPETLRVHSSPLEIVDFDLDGFPDIVLEHDCPASRPCYHRTYLFRPGTRSFEYSQDFSSPNLTNCSPIAEEHLIRCDFKCSAEEYVTVEYKVQKGRPVRTYESKKGCAAPPHPPSKSPPARTGGK